MLLGIEKEIKKVEAISVGISLLTVVAVTLVRWFLETILGSHHHISNFNFFIQSNLWFLCLFFSFVTITYFLTQEKIEKIINIFSFGWLVILFSPLVSLVVTYGKGEVNNYVKGNLNYLINAFFTFYGNLPFVSLGMKFEIIVASILIACYLYIKTKRLATSVLSIFLLYYPIGFVYGSLPSIIGIVYTTLNTLFGASYNTSANMSIWLSLILIGNGILLVYLADINLFKKIADDIRWLRVVHYSLLFLGGIFLYFRGLNQAFTWDVIPTISLLFFVCFFSFHASAYINDIFDYKIDNISNKERLLPSGLLTVKNLEKLIVVYLLLSFIFSAVLGEKIFLLVIALVSISIIYSCPPLRLKRFVFSNWIIGFISLVTFVVGFVLFGGEVVNIPSALLWTLFISISLGTVVKDIKDVKGDKKEGMLTIPIIFGKYGLVASAILIGLAFAIAPVIVASTDLLLPSFVASIIAITIVLLSNDENRERNFFSFYYLFLVYFFYSLIL